MNKKLKIAGIFAASLGCLAVVCVIFSQYRDGYIFYRYNIPPPILSVAQQLLAEELGVDFINKHLDFDSKQSALYRGSTGICQERYTEIACASYPPGAFILLVYNLHSSATGTVAAPIEFVFDGSGRQISGYDENILGLKECQKNARLCEVVIDKKQARSIAEKHISGWKREPGISFQWSALEKQFIWSIVGYTGKQDDARNYSTIFIDPATGKIIGDYWMGVIN